MNPMVLTHPNAQTLATRHEPVVDAAALSELAVHVVDTLGCRSNETDVDVLLALALAVHAPTRGHICVALASIQPDHLVPEDCEPEQVAALELPANRQDWQARVQASELVGEGAPFRLDAGSLYTQRYHQYEHQLAANLRERLVERRTPADADLLASGLNALFEPRPGLDRQRLGAAMAVLRGLTVISGGPGTGKTHTVSRVLTALWAQWATDHAEGTGPRTALAAPTGKAAARMKESIAKGLPGLVQTASPALPEGRSVDELSSFLTDLQPATLHRLLGYQPYAPTRFRHNRDNPLPHDIVIVDEASMVDFALMAKLVDAVAPHARLILLGDKNQLASVEAGTVLADIAGPVTADAVALSSGFLADLANAGIATDNIETVPPGPQDGVVLLTESRRFAAHSGIGRFASACLSDQFSTEDATELLTTSTDTTLLHHATNGLLPKDALACIVKGTRPYLDMLMCGPSSGQSLIEHHREVLVQFDRFRVLAAHRRGRLGVGGLNGATEAALKERIKGFSPTADHYLGRPIMVRRNDPVVGRYNGDVGVMVHTEDGTLTTAFLADGGVEYLAPARLPEHQTVFAMTIHKSQGSEFDHAFVVLPEASSPILTRELVYTGVTRAKTQLTLLANPAVLGEALSRTVRRASGLRAKLWETS
jgi:exodeoxyribonuclease V alpha subunit